MSTATKLQAILDSKEAIRVAIDDKGVPCDRGVVLADYANKINAISSGGGTINQAQIVDLVFDNIVEYSTNCDVNVILRVMSNNVTIGSYGVQYRQKGTTTWYNASPAIVTDNTDVKTLHGFDKIVTATISGLVYQQRWNSGGGYFVENNNRYEVRGYITDGTNTDYSEPRIFTTGWTKKFDDIYNALPNLQLGDTKQKRFIAVLPTTDISKVLSELGGDYYMTSDGYIGASYTHTFNESLDLPVYLEDGITIKYYVRWVVVYTDVASPSITIDDQNRKSFLYLSFGECTIANMKFSNDYRYGSNIESVRFSSSTTITKISSNNFFSCYGLRAIIIPSSVTIIDSYAFYNCNSLTSLVIPSSVTTIIQNAFKNCSSLTSINIPNSITSIGINAFDSCYSLTSIIIPSLVTSIPSSAFMACYALTSIIIPSSVISINSNAFYQCYALKSIIIPSSVTTIGGQVFWDCHSLTSIIIPNSVTSIGTYVFAYCKSLAFITLSSSITLVSNGTFQYCSSLKTITIPNSVTSINEYAFQDCYSLTSIIIPNSVTFIGFFAFVNCYTLTSIIIPSSVTTIINSPVLQQCLALTSITFKGIPISFPVASIILYTKAVQNVTLPDGWNQTINLVADTSTLSNNVLTHRCMLAIFNALATISGKTLTLGATNLARMSASEILIATNKGWTVN